jgi:putative transposase
MSPSAQRFAAVFATGELAMGGRRVQVRRPRARTDERELETSKSAVSRRFVAATQKELATWLSRDLGDVDLAAVMIDGLGFGDERVVLIALGIDTTGKKHVLGIHEGATENAAACGALLDDIITRGVAAERSKLFVVDGSKPLAKAIRDRFGGRALVQRCTIHKKRNVRDHLSDYLMNALQKNDERIDGRLTEASDAG